jgi:hypothetical protein
MIFLSMFRIEADAVPSCVIGMSATRLKTIVPASGSVCYAVSAEMQTALDPVGVMHRMPANAEPESSPTRAVSFPRVSIST